MRIILKAKKKKKTLLNFGAISKERSKKVEISGKNSVVMGSAFRRKVKLIIYSIIRINFLT